MSNIRVKYFLILLIFFLVSFKAVDGSAWQEYSVRDKICDTVKPDRERLPVTFSQWYPNALQKFYIPPVPPMDKLTFFVAKKPGSGSVFMAMKYGTPPDIQGDVTHPNPKPRDFVGLQSLEEGVNIRFDATGSITTPLLQMGSAALGEKAGNYLYMNFYKNRQRVSLISMTMIVDVQEAIKWCDKEFDDPEPEPVKPDQPKASPEPDTYLSDQDLTVSSANADGILYLVKVCYEPGCDPEKFASEPDRETYDHKIDSSQGVITLKAGESTQYAKYRIKLRGVNEDDYSQSTQDLVYVIDKRPKQPETVKVYGQVFENLDEIDIEPLDPKEPVITENTRQAVQVESRYATHLYYFYQLTDDGSEPGEPEIPEELNDLPEPEELLSMSDEKLQNDYPGIRAIQRIEGRFADESFNGLFSTELGKRKRIKIAFAGFNVNNSENSFGPVSHVYIFDIKGNQDSGKPGEVKVEPGSGATFTEKNSIQVSAFNADSIKYTITTDGSEPPDPTEYAYLDKRYRETRNNKITLPAQAGQITESRLRLAGYNSKSDGDKYGPVSDVYTFKVDLTAQKDEEPDEDDAPITKEECENTPGYEWNGFGDLGICKKINNENNSTTVTITLGPDEISSKASWSLDGSNWHQSDDTIEVEPGSHKIYFSYNSQDLYGWFPPAKPVSFTLQSGQDFKKEYEYRKIQPGFEVKDGEAATYPGIDISDALRSSRIDPRKKILESSGQDFSLIDLVEQRMFEISDQSRSGEVDFLSSDNEGKDLLLTLSEFKSYPVRISKVLTTSEDNWHGWSKGKLVLRSMGIEMQMTPICYDFAQIQELAESTGYEISSNSLGFLEIWENDSPVRYFLSCSYVSRDCPGTSFCLPANSNGQYQVFTPALRASQMLENDLGEAGWSYDRNTDSGEWSIKDTDNGQCYTFTPENWYHTGYRGNTDLKELDNTYVLQSPYGSQILKDFTSRKCD